MRVGRWGMEGHSCGFKRSKMSYRDTCKSDFAILGTNNVLKTKSVCHIATNSHWGYDYIFKHEHFGYWNFSLVLDQLIYKSICDIQTVGLMME